MKKIIISLGLLIALTGCVQRRVEIKTLMESTAIITMEHISVVNYSGRQCMIFILSSDIPIKTNDCRKVLELLK